MTQLYDFLQRHKVWLVYVPLVVYWIALILATSLPGKYYPKGIHISDKILHFSAYMLFAFLLGLTAHFQSKYPKWKQNKFLYVFLFVVIYGLLDEIHQDFIPGRYFDLGDWAADILGGFTGSYLVHWLLKKEFNIGKFWNQKNMKL